MENHSLYNANLFEDVSAENDLKINEAINTAISQKVLFTLMLLLKYETVSGTFSRSKTTASANVTQTISIEDVSEFATI
jgi:2-succinyl-5-enolpyruvyl-6-hydroxy-3-cyclohexene-1-carboxylate synthase